jgi:hypothetical protein
MKEAISGVAVSGGLLTIHRLQPRGARTKGSASARRPTANPKNSKYVTLWKIN